MPLFIVRLQVRFLQTAGLVDVVRQLNVGLEVWSLQTAGLVDAEG